MYTHGIHTYDVISNTIVTVFFWMTIIYGGRVTLSVFLSVMHQHWAEIHFHIVIRLNIFSVNLVLWFHRAFNQLLYLLFFLINVFSSHCCQLQYFILFSVFFSSVFIKTFSFLYMKINWILVLKIYRYTLEK